MYSKINYLIHFVIVIAISVAAMPAVVAQTSAPETATATLRGHVSDPTGAMIVGANITITTSAGTAVTSTTADASGSYTVSGLAPGGYIIQVNSEGFAPFQSTTVLLTAGQVKRVDIAMAVETEQQSVVVTDETPAVSTEAASNASAIVLKDKDLDALSDDPDELASELSALAGPSAGPNGGQIYIDGFTAGELPPKSSIREIRINSNPFSAEYDHLGYGRIEILTKAGTDKLHWRINGQGNDNVFNTGNPFTKNIPPYYSYQVSANLTGSLRKKISYNLTFEQRNNQNDNVYSFVDDAPVENADGTYSVGSLAGSLFSPQTHTNFSPRVDFQLGAKNTVTARYQFFRNSQSDVISSTQLPSLATTSTTIENSLQLSDSTIINSRAVNETHFQYNRRLTSTTPVSDAPTISTPAFTSGGAGGAAHDHTDSLELQNLTTMTMGAHALKFGMRLRDNRDANATSAGFNGSFGFNTVDDLVNTLNGTGYLAAKLNYTTGPAGVAANVFDAALFVQDDWKFNRLLTLSGGLRWESQNHIADHSDWGPRIAFAYALDGHKKKTQTKTILRGGLGFFYERFSIGSELNDVRFNGSANSQKQFTFNDPTCFSNTSVSAFVADPSLCGAAMTRTNTLQQVSPSYQSPTTIQEGTSLERQVNKNITLTATYLHSFGVHQIATIDANAYLPGTFEYGSTTLTGTRPNPALGIVNETYPEAVFKQDQLIVNIRANINTKFSLVGYYNVTAANADTGTASNSFNLSQDYGRASFASRNMLFLMGTYTGPWGITFNPFVRLQSGKPFNISTPFDLTGDNFLNDRPAFATSAQCQSGSAEFVQTQFGCFDVTPASGSEVIPINMGNGPDSKTVNLRISRSFAIGPKVAASQAQQTSGSGTGGGGMGGPGGGMGGGRMGGGGMGGGRMGGGAMGGGGMGGGSGMGGTGSSTSAKTKYTLTFSAQASNLFNDINLSNPNGAITPTLDTSTGLYGPGAQFDKSTSLAGGFGASGSAARRIFFQAALSF